MNTNNIPELKYWSFSNITKQLSGFIYNDKRFVNDTYITTTPVVDCDTEKGTVQTKTGTIYKLTTSYTNIFELISDYIEDYKRNIMNETIITDHSNLVAERVKNPEEIQESLSPLKVDLIHAVLGISGEAGELLDAIKKHSIYNKDLDIENVIEELGDLEFYMEQLRQALQITREETLSANYSKLRKRYPVGYSDKHAQERLDKVGE